MHATVDPTVGEWLKDPSNPNFGALEGVKRFKLGSAGGGVEKKVEAKGKGKEKQRHVTTGNGAEEGQEQPMDEEDVEEEEQEADVLDGDSCWYYVKMRCVFRGVLRARVPSLGSTELTGPVH